MIRMPVKISSFEILCFLIRGSRIAVKSVNEERQTKATETVAVFIDSKNNIQCNPTIAPVKNSFKNTILLSFISILSSLKYKNRLMKAIRTLYHTKCDEETDISLPNTPVKPHTKTVI